MPCSLTSQGSPSSRLPTGSALRSGRSGDGDGGDDEGQGVAADELQHDGAGPGGADPAQHRAEPVRQVLRPLRDIGRGLPGDEPDLDPVGVAGGGDRAQDGQQDPALIQRGYSGDGHHPGPPAPVAPPGPPLAPRRAADAAGKGGRPEEPPGRQDHGDPGRQRGQAEPAGIDPRERQHGQDAGGGRVPDGQADEPGQQPGQLDDQDDAERGLVDRGAPHGQRERVPVVQLGHLLARHDLAHNMITSSRFATGEKPGAAGGTSSSRPA